MDEALKNPEIECSNFFPGTLINSRETRLMKFNTNPEIKAIASVAVKSYLSSPRLWTSNNKKISISNAEPMGGPAQ